MNRVVKILMERDGMSEKEAKDTLTCVRNEIYEVIEDGDYCDVEDIIYSYLGLEMDYVLDII